MVAIKQWETIRSTQKQAMPYKKANLVFPKSNWYREFLYRIRSVSRCKKYAPGFQDFQQIHKIRLLYASFGVEQIRLMLRKVTQIVLQKCLVLRQ